MNRSAESESFKAQEAKAEARKSLLSICGFLLLSDEQINSNIPAAYVGQCALES